MSNQEVIQDFTHNDFPRIAHNDNGTLNHHRAGCWILFNGVSDGNEHVMPIAFSYNVAIVSIDTKRKEYQDNMSKYSTTTSKHQNAIIRELEAQGYKRTGYIQMLGGKPIISIDR